MAELIDEWAYKDLRGKSKDLKRWWKLIQWELIHPPDNTPPITLNLSDFQDGYSDAMVRLDEAVERLITKAEKKYY